MKKSRFFTIFMILCLIACAVPAVFMILYPSQKPVGNESLKALPEIAGEDGSINTGYLSDLGDYFEQHFAFRPQMITADAKIQAGIFGVSNTDSVLAGSDGWLFYSSTLHDYLGKEQLSERGMYNLGHNLSLLQNYVQAQGARFLFLVPPNKNTLYPEHMPYYYRVPAGAAHNRDNLARAMKEAGVCYLDLFSFFGGQEEILYLKQDSHWNNKGAFLVTDQILTALDKEHPDMAAAEAEYLPLHHGDLSNMIYPASAEAEYDYQYPMPVRFSYLSLPGSSDPVSVEDYRIQTQNPQADGSLLMYRDSFCNTLLPFLADAFSDAYFSKAVPYAIARDMQQYHPDCVIIELVERNIRNLAQNPAITPAPRSRIEPSRLKAAAQAQTLIKSCDADISFVEFSGVLPEGTIEGNENIYLGLPGADGALSVYEAFTVSTKESDFGYTLYLPVQMFGTLENAQRLSVQVFTGE